MSYLGKADGRNYALIPHAESDPVPLELNGKVYGKVVSGVMQLFYQADDGQVYQLTPPAAPPPQPTVALKPVYVDSDYPANVGEMVLVNPHAGAVGDINIGVPLGVNDGDRWGFQWAGDFSNRGIGIILANIGPGPHGGLHSYPGEYYGSHHNGNTTNLDVQGFVYTWSATNLEWVIESTIVWAMFATP